MAGLQVTDVKPWPLVEAFRRALREAYGSRLQALILYGSLARGEWTPESDIDVMVLLDDACDAKQEERSIRKLAWAVCPEGDLSLLQPIVMREVDFQRGHAPLFFNIRREGWWIMPDQEASAVEKLLGNAKQNLEDARRILEWGGADSAVSRAYYAMFNSAQAALLSRGITRSRHRGVHAAFHDYFVAQGLLPADLHRALVQAYDKRIVADYSPQSVSLEEARALVADAEALLSAVEAFTGEETK